MKKYTSIILLLLVCSINAKAHFSSASILRAIKCNGQTGAIVIRWDLPKSSMPIKVQDLVSGKTFTSNELEGAIVFDNLTAGRYNFLFEDASVAYKQPYSVDLTQPDTIAQFEKNTVLPCKDSSNGYLRISFKGGTRPYRYTWAEFPEVKVNYVSNLKAGTYHITATDTNDCHYTYTQELAEDTTCSGDTTTIRDIKQNMAIINLKVYPNPVSEILNIDINTPKTINDDLLIYNALGQITFTQKIQLQTGNNQIRISIEALPSGMYFIGFKEESMNRSRFIKGY